MDRRRLLRKRGQPRTVRDAGTMLAGGTLGAGLAFLFDPQAGRSRRARGRQQAVGALHSSMRRGQRLLRALGSRGHGYRARLFHRTPPERLHPDDATLTQKLESVLFRPADVPKGQINVNVQNGVVQLRGEVPQPEMIYDLVQTARKVAGVRDVENLLHLPGATPPMHQ